MGSQLRHPENHCIDFWTFLLFHQKINKKHDFLLFFASRIKVELQLIDV